MKHEIIGKTFKTNQGCECVVIDYVNSRHVLIRFSDRHAFERSVHIGHLRAGRATNPYHPSVMGVGFPGFGDYTVRGPDGKLTKAYQNWADMMRRCYDSSFHVGKPTYTDCVVANEWHNFQVFAEWFYAQPLGHHHDAELDKDILSPGNKIYSPEYCSLVPHRINTLLCERPARKDMPKGVHWNEQRKKYVAACHDATGKQTALGRYDCKDAAFDAYKRFKEAVIREATAMHRSLLDSRVLSALMSYEVRP
jgi:hypothetical protein